MAKKYKTRDQLIQELKAISKENKELREKLLHTEERLEKIKSKGLEAKKEMDITIHQLNQPI